MFRISLRQLLAVVTAVALAIVSLKYANLWWQAVITLVVFVGFFAAVIFAIFDRGPRQAFAIGFAIVVFCYGMSIVNGRRSFSTTGGRVTYDELHGVGYLPTTVILHELYQITFTPPIPAGEQPTNTSGVRIPSESNFVRTGHGWWALLFGYLGGSLARELDRRRRAGSQPST